MHHFHEIVDNKITWINYKYENNVNNIVNHLKRNLELNLKKYKYIPDKSVLLSF